MTKPIPRDDAPVESERVLLAHACLYQAPLDVSPGDFSRPDHRRLALIIEELAAEGAGGRAAVLDRARGQDDVFRSGGGIAAFIDALGDSAGTANLAWHADQVKDAGKRRRYRTATARFQADLCRDEDADDRAERFTVELTAIRDASVPPAAQVPLLADVAARIEFARPMPKALSTGIAPLDARLGGGVLEQATYLLVGAEGRGKSGLTIQFLRALAQLVPVLYISTELPTRQVLARFAAQILGTSWLDLLKLDPSAAHVVADALAGLPIYVHRLGRDESLTDVVARHADKIGTAPVFAVDYIQHAARRGGAADYRFAVASCMDDIVQCALDLRTSAIVVSSTGRATSRAAGEQTDPRALAQTAKENGDLEFDASAVLYLDVAEREPGGTAPTRLVVGKSRFGLDGVVGMRFDGRIGVFELDAAGALSELDRLVLGAVRDGACTSEAASAAVSRRKADVLKAIKRLAAANLIAPGGARGSDWKVVK